MNRAFNQILSLKYRASYFVINGDFAIAGSDDNINCVLPQSHGKVGLDVRDILPFLSSIRLEDLKPDQSIEKEGYVDGIHVKVTVMVMPNPERDNPESEYLVLIEDISQAEGKRERQEQESKGDRLLRGMIEKIRQSLALEEILQSTVDELQALLEIDRAFIYYFNPDWSGTVVVEALNAPWDSILDQPIDPFYSKDQIALYQKGQYSQINPLEAAELPEADRQFLSKLEVRSQLVFPIQLGIPLTLPPQNTPFKLGQSNLPITSPQHLPCDTYLWGLLIIHQCHQSRHWEPWETQLLKDISSHLSIAIQQSQLYEQLKEANQELKQLADSDSLTQLSNRRRFEQVLQKEWRRLAREKSPLGLILCDIDYFKLYNEAYGYLSGDFCLQLIADAVRQALKRPADLVARYSAEEFAVLLPHTDLLGSAHVANMIQNNIVNLDLEHKTSPVAPNVTLSIGVAALIPRIDSQPQLLLELACYVLDQAKHNGHNRIVTANSSILLNF